MKKFTFILSLFVALATTVMAQGTILSSSELNGLTESKKIAVRNLSGTNNNWLALTNSVATLSPEAVLVWEPAGDGKFYLSAAYAEGEAYVQAAASGAVTLGAKATAQLFYTTQPSVTGAGETQFSGEAVAEGSDLENFVRFVQDGGSTWLNCQSAASAPVLGNSGKGGWTVHNVYDMSNSYILTVNVVKDGETTTVKQMVEAGATIEVEDIEGYINDLQAQEMPAADTEITVNYTKVQWLVNLSTESDRNYYRIDSHSRGGCLTWVSADGSIQHIDESENSYWYFIKANDKGGVYIRNYTTEQYLGAGLTMSDEPAVWYILPNGVNEEGYSISSTNPISSNSCIDANNWSSGIGTWQPASEDWDGTTWRFEVVNPEGTGEPEPEPELVEVITELSQLSNSRKYFIESKRCFLMYSETYPDKLATSNATLDEAVAKDPTSAAQQFKIEKSGDSYYLYSVAAGKYVSKDGKFSDTKVDALTLTTVTGRDPYNWLLIVGGNGLNTQVKGQYDAGIVVNSWTSADEGNCFKIIDAEFAITVEVLAAKQELDAMVAYANDILESRSMTAEQTAAIEAAILAAQTAYEEIKSTTPTMDQVNDLRTLIAAIETAINDAIYLKSLENLSNSVAYSLSTDNRGTWVSNGTAVTSTVQLGVEKDATSVAQHFAFVKSEKGAIYLYSVSDKKFVSKSGQGTKYTDIPEQSVYFQNGTYGGCPWVVTLEDGSQMGVSNGYNPAVITFWNDLNDAGNCVNIEAVASFDPSEALAAIAEYESRGQYVIALNNVVAQLDVYAVCIGTKVGYLQSSDAEFATKYQAIKDFVAAIDSKSIAEIQAQTAVVEALLPTFSTILPTDGKYYFVKNNSKVWTAGVEYGLYANGEAPAWMAFDGNNVNFWWKAEVTEGGVAIKNVANNMYITGNAARSGDWTLGEAANAITFDTKGVAENGNALVGLTLEGFNMHAGGHNGGAGTSGTIVSWNGDATSASAWEIVEADAAQLAALYRGNVEAAMAEIAPWKNLLGDSYGLYSCDEELMQQVEEFDVETATYEELVAIYAVIGQLRASFKINTPKAGVSYVRIKAGVAGWNDDAPYLGAANSETNTSRAQFISSSAADANSIFFYCEDNCLVSYGSGKHLVNNNNFLGYSDDVTVEGTEVAFNSGETFGTYGITFLGNGDAARSLYINQNNYTDAATPGAKGDGYTFSLEAVTTLPVIVTTAGYASFFTPVAVTIPAGVKAYYAEAINGEVVELKEITTTIPANTGVILEAEAGTYNFAISNEEVEAIEGNLFGGTVAKTLINKENGAYYILGIVDGVVGMYNPVSGDNKDAFINAGHKAYMYVEGASNSAGYRFGFDGTTGITEVENEAAEVVIYDITGRRVQNMNRAGIYIVNGKKVLVK